MDQELSVPWMKGYLPLERKRLPTCGSGAVCSFDDMDMELYGAGKQTLRYLVRETATTLFGQGIRHYVTWSVQIIFINIHSESLRHLFLSNKQKVQQTINK